MSDVLKGKTKYELIAFFKNAIRDFDSYDQARWNCFNKAERDDRLAEYLADLVKK